MKKQEEIKALKSAIAEVDRLIEVVKASTSALSKEMAALTKEKLGYLYQLDTLLGKETIVVSDHALMRYCERVLGINMDEVKEKILTESAMGLIDKLKAGDGQYPVKEGDFVIRLKNKTVVTII